MIVMKTGATPEQVAEVVGEIKRHGLRSDVSTGEFRTVIGIVGEYVGRIYDQVRGRPLTIIEHTINMGEKQPKTDPAQT